MEPGPRLITGTVARLRTMCSKPGRNGTLGVSHRLERLDGAAAAAYGDYHVTGLNPAGNATLTDLAFVASRFRITQSRALAA